MLVLSRKKDERIVIGKAGEITITVVEIRKDGVRLGIEAPKEVPVNRQEVHDAIQKKKEKEKEKQPPSSGEGPMLTSEP